MFDPVLVARSWVSATKWGPLAKLLAVAIVYEPTLIQFGADILKIVAGGVFLNGSF